MFYWVVLAVLNSDNFQLPIFCPQVEVLRIGEKNESKISIGIDQILLGLWVQGQVEFYRVF